MKIDILDIEKLIAVNKLKPCTSPKLFGNNKTYHPDGILSGEIFGISKKDRRGQFAYIDLKGPFIHPHIYDNILSRTVRAVVYIVSGQKKYSVSSAGVLVEDSDNGWTGLYNLYKHWDEINWSKLKSSNERNIHLLANTNKKQIFITKFPICPPAYRDVMISGVMDSSEHINPVNPLYTKIISAVELLESGGLFSRIQYATQAKIQQLLVEVYKHFKDQISRKTGLIRMNLMGKRISYGARSVISGVTYNNDRFEDNMVDINHIVVPISTCCSCFYPFIQAWIKNFFMNSTKMGNFTNEDELNKKGYTLKDPSIQFSDKRMRKMIDNYIFNPDSRFKLVELEFISEDGKNLKKNYIVLKGKLILPNNVEQELNRPMTLTDLLYLACVDVCEKRHAYVTRYPIGFDKGLIYGKIRVQSTVSHVKVIYNGKEYPYYPNIDLSVPTEQVGIQFIDTLVFSNSHLDGMNGDYDGDQVTIRGIWSEEANEDIRRIMNSKISLLDITGQNVKTVKQEVLDSMYELTKIGFAESKVVSPEDTKEYLETPISEYTRTFILKNITDTASGPSKNIKKKSKYNVWDIITIPTNYFYNDQPSTKLTLGRFILNKFILEGSGIIAQTKIVDKIIDKKGFGNLNSLVGNLYLDDKINRKQIDDFIDRRDTLGYWLIAPLSATITESFMKTNPLVEKRKKELLKKYEKELEANDIDTMKKIENELCEYSKEVLDKDPGMDQYKSGYLNWTNNYKNNFILKGPSIDPITGEYDFIAHSFSDGIDIKDLPAYSNTIVASQYQQGIGTKNSGYMGKKLMSLLQLMTIDEPGSDCHTKNLIPILITKRNASRMIYVWIQEGKGLKLLTPENVNDYIGQTVMMRSPMSCCSHDKICSKCAGEFFYKLGIRNIGLFPSTISYRFLNGSMNMKHNMTVNLFELDPDKFIEPA